MARSAELAPGGVAAIVFGAAEPVEPRRRRRGSGALPEGGISAIVLGRAARTGRALAAALVAAGAFHAGVAAAAAHWSHSPAGTPPPARTEPLRVERVVDLAPPPAPAPPADEPAPPEAPRAAPAPARRGAPSKAAPGPRSGPPAPPAAAGQVVAAGPAAAETLDFTGFDIAAGEGPRYAGGVTASSGAGTRAVHGPSVDRKAPPGSSEGGSRSRPVGLPAAAWSCPWPSEAEALSIEEEVVVLRVVVRADGTVASASLVSDPGHGFGAVAIACARARRFRPATDDAGAPIAATSPPVRIRFTRSSR